MSAPAAELVHTNIDWPNTAVVANRPHKMRNSLRSLSLIFIDRRVSIPADKAVDRTAAFGGVYLVFIGVVGWLDGTDYVIQLLLRELLP
jgi:hypothetical protein